jgi:ABC-2 type transport system ATP-binding protein
MLQVRRVTKRYGDIEAVSGLSFNISEGEVFGLLGPNGAGKTTLIKIIAGLIAPDSGEVTVDGLEVHSNWERVKSLLGIVPQELSFYPGLSAVENLLLFGRLYGVPGRLLQKRVTSLLSLVGLSDRARQWVKRYSGGMKRRLNLALSLISSPKILLLDEPTVGLDPQTRALVHQLIGGFKGEGISILLTTHYIEEAERLCDRVAIIDEGRIIALAPPKELIEEFTPEEIVEVEAREDLSSVKKGVEEGLTSFSPRVVGKRIILSLKEGRKKLPAIFEQVVSLGIEPSSIQLREPDLETVFLSLTGKELRD